MKLKLTKAVTDTGDTIFRIYAWDEGVWKWKQSCMQEMQARAVIARMMLPPEAERTIEEFDSEPEAPEPDEPADDYYERQAERADYAREKENQDLRDAGRGHLVRP